MINRVWMMRHFPGCVIHIFFVVFYVETVRIMYYINHNIKK